MIVFAEATELMPPSSSRRDLETSIEAARLAGCRLYFIPPDFSEISAENALDLVPEQAEAQPAVWLGYIPSPDRYRELYDAAARKNIFLLNSLEEHRRTQEFDLAYPHLDGLTPRSRIVTSVDECPSAVAELGLPLFVKGAVQSRKGRGWKACVAESGDELAALVQSLLGSENRSRGRVVVRELVRLRHSRDINGFPQGREYRVILYRQEILGLGYYWEGPDPLRELSPAERDSVEALAREAARRLAVPYVTVDIGQTEAGDWIVIETGDPQFSGLSQIQPLGLWSKIARLEIYSGSQTE
jgi:hypothetical protein